MTTPVVKAWSYSALATFEECALRYYHTKLVKDVADPPGPALLKGRKVHKEGEVYLKTPSMQDVPATYARFDRLMRQLKSLNPYSELQITFRRDWSLGSTGWFGKDVWLRSAYDAVVVYNDAPKHVDMIDFKTGKRYDSNDEQLELFALTAFLKWKPETVQTRLWYLDSGLEVPKTFEASQVPQLLSKWTAKAQKLFDETHWLPKPGKACDYCPVGKSRGGKCRYG